MMHLAFVLLTFVGFANIHVPDGATTIEAGVWYPTTSAARPTPIGLFMQDVAPDAALDGRDLPLVAISHGTGGDFASHLDTACALAKAGFVVVALTHTGDNWRDQSRALDVLDRARQLHVVIDYMLTQWHGGVVNPRRVGAFGFSSGGFTVLVASGGTPDLSLVAAHCAAHPDFFDCRLGAAHPINRSGSTPEAIVRDERIRASAIAAPAIGYAFKPNGLKGVRIPIQLWRAADDQILPAPYYADAVRAALPNAPEFHDVPRAGHFDFLAPCSASLAAVNSAICSSEAGFDRAKFHATFNAAVVRFFEANLAS